MGIVNVMRGGGLGGGGGEGGGRGGGGELDGVACLENLQSCEFEDLAVCVLIAISIAAQRSAEQNILYVVLFGLILCAMDHVSGIVVYDSGHNVHSGLCLGIVKARVPIGVRGRPYQYSFMLLLEREKYI